MTNSNLIITDEMPYTVAFRNANTRTTTTNTKIAQEELSLALLNRNNQILRDGIYHSYIGHPENYTACHEIAAKLYELIRTNNQNNRIYENATLQNLTEIGNELNIKRALVIWLQYGYHSVTLLTTHRSVECMEAWAGSTPGTQMAVIVFPFYKCIWERISEKRPTINDTVTAIAHLLDNKQQIREQAWNTISRAGLQGFESNQGIRPLKVSIAHAEAPAIVEEKMIEQIMSWRRFMQ
ncbi:MAG: hypothetical protein FWK04_16355 [Nostoc sp. GBBB01]|uniref:Uncharacterized protein n=1 Tax=Nostoc punctiforme FACHB-252 TaxID=1357509 RepID=A0ABR8HAC5_NOSPU|nr:hypothetical protein [Nostoc punctiforme]MBD2612566.1 hypothetical protein [Nostoc punctiforme FACHB-252]MBL1200616.1 hypothetical protein [Nostoc sp. GBBB01]